MARIKKNLTLHPGVVERAHRLMTARDFDDFSQFVSTLIREEYDRRVASGHHGTYPAALALHDAPRPPK